MSDSHHEGAAEAALPRGGFTKAFLGRAAKSSLFSDKVLFSLLTGLVFLLPIFFIPNPQVAPEFAKMLLLEGVALFAVFAWAMGRLRDGHVEMPKSLLLGVSFLLLLQFVVSAVVSPVPSVSFLGSGYDVGTVNMVAVLFLLLFLSSTMYRTRDRVLYLLAAFMLSSGLVTLYHLLRHVIGSPSFLDFGIFTGPTTSPVGKWNDFASFVGASTLISLVSLYFFSANKSIRFLSYAYFLFGLFFLILIDFTILWFVLFVLAGGIIALAIYEGELSHRHRHQATGESGGEHHHVHAKPLPRRLMGHLPVLTTLLLVVAFLYGSGLTSYPLTKDGKSVSSIIGNTFHAAPYSEVVLTSSLTYDIISGALKESPFFGAGPNRFAPVYLQHKTSSINITPFWDTTFDTGIGRIPTFFAATGLIGILLWLAFIGLLFWKGRKIYALLARDRVAAFIGFTLFILAIYFWGLAFFYVPNITIFAYAFIITGALVAFLAGEGMVPMYKAQFTGKLSLVLTPVIVMIMIGSIAAGVLIWRQTASLVYFNEARIAIGNNDIGGAETAITKAIAMNDRPIYWRFVASLDLAKLEKLAQNTALPQADRVAAANQYIADARAAAEHAVASDPTDFENYMATGGVYDALGTFGIGNTFESARAEYAKALALNPHSPRVLFLLGRVALLGGDRTGAENYFAQALAERPNFIEALSVLSQLELQDQHPEKAEGLLLNAIQVEPGNFVLRFTLGYLQYSVRDYKNAVVSLESAVMLNPVYANAKYFLGLSYARLGRIDEAIQQFTDVAQLNPDNVDVPRIIRNLKSGRDPLDPNIVPPPPSGEVLETDKIPEVKASEKTTTPPSKPKTTTKTKTTTPPPAPTQPTPEPPVQEQPNPTL